MEKNFDCPLDKQLRHMRILIVHCYGDYIFLYIEAHPEYLTLINNIDLI